MTIQAAADALAQAIARAEGYFVPGSLPARINNPGDLELGDRGNGVTNGKTHYPSPFAGWEALRSETTMILAGKSHYIKPSMPLSQVAEVYTGHDNAPAWADIVAKAIGITPDATLQSFLDRP